jgi:hypothetical protein
LFPTKKIDSTLADSDTSGKSGYKFTSDKADAANGTASTFGAVGKPVTTSGVTATGTRDFAIGTDGVLYSGAAGALTLSKTGATGTSTVLNN